MSTKRKRHRVIDPAKARRASGGAGGSFYDRIISAETTRAACAKCGTYSTLIGADGRCLKCNLALRKAREAVTEAAGPF